MNDSTITLIPPLSLSPSNVPFIFTNHLFSFIVLFLFFCIDPKHQHCCELPYLPAKEELAERAHPVRQVYSGCCMPHLLINSLHPRRVCILYSTSPLPPTSLPPPSHLPPTSLPPPSHHLVLFETEQITSSSSEEGAITKGYTAWDACAYYWEPTLPCDGIHKNKMIKHMFRNIPRSKNKTRRKLRKIFYFIKKSCTRWDLNPRLLSDKINKKFVVGVCISSPLLLLITLSSLALSTFIHENQHF